MSKASGKHHYVTSKFNSVFVFHRWLPRSSSYDSQLVSYLKSAALVIATSLLVISLGFQSVGASDGEDGLPPLKIHPLPSYLAKWQDDFGVGDYFSEIKSTQVGYLVWSEFPIEVYIERPIKPTEATASTQRFQKWVEKVEVGVREWGVYLPLVEVEEASGADIVIKRSPPPLKATVNPETGLLDIAPARSAQTTYEFYINKEKKPKLSHRMIIEVSPNLSDDYILAAIRHELGHGLGIWGHSPRETDALYFSQVRDTPPISARDINTLKKIYQQPTRLGWAVK